MFDFLHLGEPERFASLEQKLDWLIRTQQHLLKGLNHYMADQVQMTTDVEALVASVSSMSDAINTSNDLVITLVAAYNSAKTAPPSTDFTSLDNDVNAALVKAQSAISTAQQSASSINSALAPATSTPVTPVEAAPAGDATGTVDQSTTGADALPGTQAATQS